MFSMLPVWLSLILFTPANNNIMTAVYMWEVRAESLLCYDSTDDTSTPAPAPLLS